MMDEFSGKHSSNYVGVEFTTNAPQGGNHSHGGFLSVTFRNAGGDARLAAEVEGQPEEQANTVTIYFRGDLEVESAASCIIALADALKVILPTLANTREPA